MEVVVARLQHQVKLSRMEAVAAVVLAVDPVTALLQVIVTRVVEVAAPVEVPHRSTEMT